MRLKLGDDARYGELASIAEQQVERLERMLTDVLWLGRPLTMNVQLRERRHSIAGAMESFPS